MSNREGLDRSSAVQSVPSNTSGRAHRKYEDEYERGWETSKKAVSAPAQDGTVFDGGHATSTTLEGVGRGEGGYGNRLSAASTVAAGEHAGEWGMIATPVTPVLAPCEEGIAEQQAAVERLDHTEHTWGDPAWVQAGRAYSQAWAGENQQSMMRYEADQNAQCMAFNSWVPIANASHAAMAEMVEAAQLLGFDPSKDTDSVAFIKAIETSLDMAKNLVDAPLLGPAKEAWSNRTADAFAHAHVQPKLDGTEVGTEIQLLKDAYRTLRDAYLDVYRSLLEDKKKLVDQTIGEDQAKVAEINDVIGFWTQLGGVASGAVPYVNSGIRADSRISKSIAFGKYKGKAMRHAAEKQAVHAEKNPSDYESEVDAHAKFDDYDGNEESWGKGQSSVEANGPQVPVMSAREELPSLSVSGLISFGLKLWSKGSLEQLKGMIASLKSTSLGLAATIDYSETVSASQKYAAAGKTFEERLANVGGHTLVLRQQDFMDTGSQLDAYAMEHRADLAAQGKGNLAPGGGHEIYGTMMAAMGKIEQYRALSSLALGTFDYDGFSTTIRDQQLERANVKRPKESADRDPSHAYKRPPDVRPMSSDELAVYKQIGGAYLSVSQQDAHWKVRLSGIVPRFELLMTRLAGHGDKGIGRQY
jgi:hypothetical protein